MSGDFLQGLVDQAESVLRHDPAKVIQQAGANVIAVAGKDTQGRDQEKRHGDQGSQEVVGESGAACEDFVMINFMPDPLAELDG